jgi:hypothetical protein
VKETGRLKKPKNFYAIQHNGKPSSQLCQESIQWMTDSFNPEFQRTETQGMNWMHAVHFFCATRRKERLGKIT